MISARLSPCVQVRDTPWLANSEALQPGLIFFSTAVKGKCMGRLGYKSCSDVALLILLQKLKDFSHIYV